MIKSASNGSTTQHVQASPLVPRREIQAFVDDVARRFRPQRVILFGSYAHGEPNVDSDVDLLVVMRHRRAGSKMASRILLQCQSRFAVELLVRSPVAIRKRLSMGAPFIGEIVAKGVTLCEGDHSRVG